MKAAMAARAGSSPLARGLPAREELEMTSVRIIPARAGFTDRAPAPRRDSPDHPRSRGVYSLVQPAPERIQGSSPLARGLPWRIWPGCSRLGIIPARAGFTRLSQWSHEVPPDHPRSRGVYYLWTDAGQFGAGSSPLARGLQEPSRRARAPGRIIPARAGFTSPTQPNPTSGPDHPRSRGVYTLIPRASGDAPGSSPLARGLRTPKIEPRRDERIIPARAGFTSFSDPFLYGPKDHPRSRGVYTSPAPQTTCCTGSSPLARGLLSVASGVPETVLDHPRSRGVYAARAALVRGREDHPRSRGVYTLIIRAPYHPDGSSPLARGLPPRDLASLTRRRIIPARAGFTALWRGPAGPHPDHPRSRGVYMIASAHMGSRRGSSPLARGLPGIRRWRRRRSGIIPARAGFTRSRRTRTA